MQYSINGSLTITYLAGTDVSTREYPPISYTVAVNDCKSSVSLLDTTKRPAGTVHSTFDGQTRIQWTGEGDEVNAVVILQEHVPSYTPIPHLPIIWMASMSGCYFVGGLVDKMPVPYATTVERRVINVAFETENDAEIPSRWTFLEDSGQTNGVFQVESYAQVGGAKVPKDYSLLVYGGSANRGRSVVFQARGSQSVSSLDQRIETNPKLAAKAYNHDLRFVSPDTKQKYPFTYYTNKILTTEEVRSLPGFPQYLEVERATSSGGGLENRTSTIGKSGRYRWLGWLFFTAFIFVPLFFLAKSRRKTKTNIR